MRWAAALLIVGGFLGFMVWNIASQGQYECEVCITFGGRTDCQLGSAATRQEAVEAGKTPACQALARGVTEAFACSATPPSSVKCTPE
jgi:hypothetical protein